MKRIKYLFLIMIMSLIFLPISKVKANTMINEVTVEIDRPIVGDKVWPVGYTGEDLDVIPDDGNSSPDSHPSMHAITEGVTVSNMYWKPSPADTDGLFFGKFKKSTDYYAEAKIRAASGYQLAEDVVIKYRYKVGEVYLTANATWQEDHIHYEAGIGPTYTYFIGTVPSLNQFTVTFDSKGGSSVPSVTLTGSGATQSANIPVPEAPTKAGARFLEWYDNEDCNGEPFNFDMAVSDSMTLYAKYIDLEDYVITNGDLTAMFTYDTGHDFELNFFDVLTLSVEELNTMTGQTMTEEEFEQIKNLVMKNTKQYGNILGLFGIEINDGTIAYTGETQFKLKLNDEMKKYDTFKFLYLDENNNFKVGEIVNFKIEGDYLVGTLPHLSAYALVGNKVEVSGANPPTGDGVYVYFALLGVSLLSTFVARKRRIN